MKDRVKKCRWYYFQTLTVEGHTVYTSHYAEDFNAARWLACEVFGKCYPYSTHFKSISKAEYYSHRCNEVSNEL